MLWSSHIIGVLFACNSADRFVGVGTGAKSHDQPICSLHCIHIPILAPGATPRWCHPRSFLRLFRSVIETNSQRMLFFQFKPSPGYGGTGWLECRGSKSGGCPKTVRQGSRQILHVVSCDADVPLAFPQLGLEPGGCFAHKCGCRNGLLRYALRTPLLSPLLIQFGSERRRSCVAKR